MVVLLESLEQRRLLSGHAAHPASLSDDLSAPVLHASRAKSAQDAAYLHAVETVKQRFHIPGVAVGISDKNGTVWQAALGKDVGTGAPISLDEQFGIRSITKSFTVTLILQLARRKKLSLNDPIEKYFPGIPNGKEITLTQLAAMESGVKSYTAVDDFLDEFIDSKFLKQWTAPEIIKFTIPESPIFDPGEKYDYSNTNTLLLGIVAEKVSHLSLAEAYDKYIFKPLGLSHTSYPDNLDFPSPHPKTYEVDPKTGALSEYGPVNLSALGAAGGIVSNLHDLLIWGRALGTGSLIGNKLQQLRMSHSRRATDGPEYDRYGIGMGELKGWWGHTGEALGYQAATFYDRRTGLTIAVLVNSSQPVNVATEVFKALAGVINPKPLPGKAHHFSDHLLTDPDSNGLLE